MRDLTEESLAAGAFGFTTSRTNSHKTLTGEFVPGRYSEVQELTGIGSCLANFDYGAFGMNSACTMLLMNSVVARNTKN